MVGGGPAGACPPPPAPPRPCACAAGLRRVRAVARRTVIRMRGFYSDRWRAEDIDDSNPRSGIDDHGSGSRSPGSRRLLILRQYFAGVHEALRVECVLDGAHHVEGVAAVLGFEELDLPDSHAVFAGAGA